MTDLHGWITQQVDEAERRAREGQVVVLNEQGRYPLPEFAVDRDAVLRRCEADRRILARHRLATEWTWAHDEPCHGCGVMGDCDDPVTEHLNECPELLDLGHAHGLTDEILAGLDRPEMPPRPVFKPRGPVPDTRRVPAALRGPNWSSR